MTIKDYKYYMAISGSSTLKNPDSMIRQLKSDTDTIERLNKTDSTWRYFRSLHKLFFGDSDTKLVEISGKKAIALYSKWFPNKDTKRSFIPA